MKPAVTRTIAAGAFKTHCLSLLDQVRDNHEEVVITKRGVPVAKLVPVGEKKPESLLGCMKGQFEIVGDIVSPITEPWEWDEDIFPPGTGKRDEFERGEAQKRNSGE